jgi:hypothetical protein
MGPHGHQARESNGCRAGVYGTSHAWTWTKRCTGTLLCLPHRTKTAPEPPAGSVVVLAAPANPATCYAVQQLRTDFTWQWQPVSHPIHHICAQWGTLRYVRLGHCTCRLSRCKYTHQSLSVHLGCPVKGIVQGLYRKLHQFDSAHINDASTYVRLWAQDFVYDAGPSSG